jgi:hypothetical protein
MVEPSRGDSEFVMPALLGASIELLVEWSKLAGKIACKVVRHNGLQAKLKRVRRHRQLFEWAQEL